MSKTPTHPQNQHRFIERLTLRGFIGKIIGGIAALIGITLVLPLTGSIILPALRRKAEKWIDILDKRQLKPESPLSVEMVTSLKDGWRTTTSLKTVWVVKKEEGEVLIYSPLCTHLGCGYRWEEEKSIFLCPCHASVFDINGKVLSGPAPRPLDTLLIKIEGNRISTIYKEYKAGTSKKIEL